MSFNKVMQTKFIFKELISDEEITVFLLKKMLFSPNFFLLINEHYSLENLKKFIDTLLLETFPRTFYNLIGKCIENNNFKELFITLIITSYICQFNDNLEKYILPNLGKEDLTEDEKSEIIRIFKHFSFKMFDIIRKENKKTEKEKQDILILLSGINKEKKLEKLFGHKEIHKKILEKIYFKLNRIVLSKSFSLAITLLIWFGFVLISWYYDKWQIFGTLTSFGFIYLFKTSPEVNY